MAAASGNRRDKDVGKIDSTLHPARLQKGIGPDEYESEEETFGRTIRRGRETRAEYREQSCVSYLLVLLSPLGVQQTGTISVPREFGSNHHGFVCIRCFAS